GLGVETYTEAFQGFETLRFNYWYVGLPGLKAEDYLAGNNWLGVALAALMHAPRQQKPWLRAELLRRLWVECQENDYRKFLLTECVEAYLGLDEEQERQFQELLHTERYREVMPMMTTTFEKGLQQGREEGLQQGQRQLLRIQLEKRFGPLPPAVV